MGVITLVTIDYGRIYGPLPKSSVVTDPVSHIGSLTNQNSCQRITLQVNPDEAKELNEPMEWLCYIHPAKTEDEQNMEAYIKEGQIYYRALRMIKAHEELLIWYSKDFAMLIGIPELQRPANGEVLDYSCPYCGERFDYPFPLRAHVRFKCPQRRVWSNADHFTKIPVLSQPPEGSPPPSPEQRHSKDSYSPEGKVKKLTTEPRSLKRDGEKTRNVECSPDKRQDRDRHGANVKTFSPESKDKSFDYNQNIKTNSLGTEDGHSAFRKVEKHSIESLNGSPSAKTSVSSSSREINCGLSLVPPSSMTQISSLAAHGGVRGNMFLESRLPVYPMMPPLHPAMVHLPRPGIFGGIPMGSGGIHRQMKSKMEEAEGDLKNIENSNPRLISPIKPPAMFEKSRNPYSAIRTMNPMMDKMMHSPVPTGMHPPLGNASFLQNSCAQCNASFRMTSDLVYHMRSHHKREFDPMKRKREEKLRCNICSESFRERHHLTRHMTSHL